MKLSKKPNNSENAISRLVTRGVTEAIDRDHLVSELRSGRALRVKLGIDPTGPNIHLGRAIPLRKLRAFQDMGHKAVLIVGDFTAQIGDPSDKLDKRPMLTRERIKEYLAGYKKQLGKIIDLSRAEFYFNSKWLGKLGFGEIAALAECFSIGQMLERRNFKERFERQEEISLREFMYPLMQGYDSVAVKADVELGGFDQLFNLMAGRVIQKNYGQKEQDIMTFEMLEGTDGRKMSSSWGNVITVTDLPKDMFGKIMSLKDEFISKYFLLCTDVSENDIEKMEKDMKNGGLNPRDAKMRLGKEIVAIYHSWADAERAAEEFDSVFKNKELPSDIEEISLAADSMNAVDILVFSGLSSSKSEARRLVEQGGLKINGERITDPDAVIAIADGVVIQAGKRRFAKIVK